MYCGTVKRWYAASSFQFEHAGLIESGVQRRRDFDRIRKECQRNERRESEVRLAANDLIIIQNFSPLYMESSMRFAAMCQ